MGDEDKDRLVYDAVMRQLERMRGMQYAYHRHFFQWMSLTAVLLLVFLLLPRHAGFPFLPFLVVTAGVQASFYLHFCDFARIHSRHLEQKINGLLGLKILLGSELEDLYFYPQGPGKIAGLLPRQPARFFNVYTLHWMVLWSCAFFAGLYYVHAVYGKRLFLIYAAASLVWAGLHLVYITWYFGRGRDLEAVSRHLQDELGQPFSSHPA